MLIVNTEIKESSIHGTGLFCSEKLVAGQIIWVLHKNLDALISIDEWQLLVKPAQEYLRTYMYWSQRKKTYVACLDNGRFMNHADKANTHGAYYNDLKELAPHILDKTGMSEKQWAMVDLSEGFTVASRDIEVGEELTSNYDIDFPDGGGLSPNISQG